MLTIAIAVLTGAILGFVADHFFGKRLDQAKTDITKQITAEFSTLHRKVQSIETALGIGASVGGAKPKTKGKSGG